MPAQPDLRFLAPSPGVAAVACDDDAFPLVRAAARRRQGTGAGAWCTVPSRVRALALPGMLLLAAVGIVASAGAQARDGVAVEAGYGYHVDMERLTLTRDWDAPLLSGEAWSVAPYWDLALGHWHAHNPAGDNHDVVDLGITPVLRVTERVRSALAPYAELGVGAHYISDHRIYAGRNMSTHFQFGDHVGAGVSFGAAQEFDLGVRLQHLSNAGLKNPNPGINFYQVRAAYHF